MKKKKDDDDEVERQGKKGDRSGSQWRESRFEAEAEEEEEEQRQLTDGQLRNSGLCQTRQANALKGSATVVSSGNPAKMNGPQGRGEARGPWSHKSAAPKLTLSPSLSHFGALTRSVQVVSL